MFDIFGAVANLGGSIIADRRAGIEGRRAENTQREALRLAYPKELQNLRGDYYTTMSSFAPQLLGGGFGNYGTYNPYQIGQSPFANYLDSNYQNIPRNGEPQINSPYNEKLVRSGNDSRFTLTEEQANSPDFISGVPNPTPSRVAPNDSGYVIGNGSGDGGNVPYLDTNLSARNQDSTQNIIGPDGVPVQIIQAGGTGDGAGSVAIRETQNYLNSNPGAIGQLALLNQAGQVAYNPQIDALVGQQGQNIQNAQGLNLANLLQLQQQLGGINQNSQQGLQQLINQSQGNNQNIQNLFAQQSQQQLGGNNPQAQAFANLLGLGQNFAQGGQDTSGFNQFSGAVGGALQTNQGQLGGIDQQTQALIDANKASSQFEQDKALQELNDQLSARGLANSQAGTEAISGAMAQFARQRALDEAKIRQEALNTGFAQRQQALGMQGNLAGQGANILSQQGQLGNADLNARLRALDTSGNLAQGAGVNQSRGINDLIQLLGANQSGIGNVNSLQNQANQQQAGFAQTNYGLNQQAINNPQDALSQLLALYGQNEQRNQAIGQQGFANRGAIFDRGNAMLTNALSGAQQGAIQASSINANQAQNYFNQANANRQASGQMLGQAFEHLNNAYSNYNQNKNPGYTPYNGPTYPNYFNNTVGQSFQQSYPQQQAGGFYDTETFNPGY